MNRPKIIFMNSSGRSGTKSFHQAFDSLPNVISYHGARPKVEKENNLRYKLYKVAEQIDTLRERRLPLIHDAIVEKKHFVECTWFMTAFTRDLAKLFPSCTIIHLIRDGRDFVRSGWVRPWFVEGNFSYMSSIHSWSRDRFDPPSECQDRFSKICWLWAEQQRIMNYGMKRLKEWNNGGLVRVEDYRNKDLQPFFRTLGVLPKGWNKPIKMPVSNVTAKHEFPK